MITIPKTDFLKVWAERAFDRVQIAQIEAIETAMVDYALNAWRSVHNEPPPSGELLQTACPNAGLQLLRLAENGEDWRTSTGQPARAPMYWMPGPELPIMQRE